jgi:hypothetical protein
MRVRNIRSFINNGRARTPVDHFREAENLSLRACNDAMHMHPFVHGTRKLPFGEGEPHPALDVR